MVCFYAVKSQYFKRTKQTPLSKDIVYNISKVKQSKYYIFMNAANSNIETLLFVFYFIDTFTCLTSMNNLKINMPMSNSV